MAAAGGIEADHAVGGGAAGRDDAKCEPRQKQSDYRQSDLPEARNQV